MSIIGARQERSNRCEYHGAHHERTASDGDVAGDLVPGIQSGEAFAEGGCHDPRGEDVTRRFGGGVEYGD